MASAPLSFAGLRRAADQIKGSQLPSYATATTSLSKHIPASFTWQDLAEGLAQPQDQDHAGRVLALRACLDAEPSRLQQNSHDDDDAARRQIRRFVTAVVSPTVAHDERDDDDLTHGEDLADRRDAAVRRCRAYAGSAVAVLERVGLPLPGLKVKKVEEEDDDDAQVVYTLIALADAGQPWTTDAAADSARRLLASAMVDATTKRQWIVDGMLTAYLRPLFARSRPATITESGRKAAYGSSGGGGGHAAHGITNAESPKAKPWKYVDLRAVSVAAWAVQEADEPLIRQHWPLFVPVLLALVDDPDTPVRARGLGLLRVFVDTAPKTGSGSLDGKAGLLHATGLDSVLADAVFPTLLFLPRLTPEKESLQLLRPAYEALLSLASASAASSSSSSSSSSSTDTAARLALLDRILRDGVYTGYFHASEHIRIVEELVRQAGHVVQAMGLDAVKHLKDLLPLYANVMTDPFAMRYVPAVAAAVDALQTTITACWPRMAATAWQHETIRMLMLCWLNAEEDKAMQQQQQQQQQKADLQQRLAATASTLLAVMRAAHVDVDAAVGPLVSKEPRLARLFVDVSAD